ncbi:GNAT family N-acetyltransferase [Phyllobacterium sp. YR531]|uniref:GNAT family N-acetyltransferase n=1 Tax=Phyllobacterium sp. YR531 TaxID=1144343 RepID=UPI0012F64F85|nr:GNAT family N-acetyltransferase [Phyllobacterium sp. YR531]
MPFLRELYRSFRFDDLTPLPWSIEEKHAFLDQQFGMQHRYYLAVFPKADFLVIERNSLPIGRLYINTSSCPWHIIDIGFLPEWQKQGLGRALLQDIQNAVATRHDCSVILHVERANVRARSLYQSLGFVITDDTDTHIGMTWPAPVS